MNWSSRKILCLIATVCSVQAASLDDGVEPVEPVELGVGMISADEIAAFEGVVDLASEERKPIVHFDGPISETTLPPIDEFLHSREPTSGFAVPQAIPSLDLELPKPVQRKSPFLAVTLSTFVPGLGHAYLGDMKTAGGLIGTAGLSIGSGVAFHSDPVVFFTSLETTINTWMYGIYAAYRDVRKHNGQEGYLHTMPTDSLADLAYAPFNISVIKKPEVWGGLLGSFVLVAGASYLAFSKNIHPRAAHSLSKSFSPVVALPIGIGEESFFRGFLQSTLSESLTPWGGIILSSLLFGAAHIGNGQAMSPQNRDGYYRFILPFITLTGIYDGWLTYKNHSLKSSVAIHTWYDFAVFAISALATRSVAQGRTQFAVALPF